MDVYIRDMLPGDAGAINDLSRQLGYPLSIDETKACMKNVMTSDGHIALVATDDKKVIGWIHGFKTIHLVGKPFIEIGGLVVDESYRNRHIGKKLLEKVGEWGLKQDINVRVRSNIKRREAHRFYLNNGFTEIKEQKVFEQQL